MPKQYKTYTFHCYVCHTDHSYLEASPGDAKKKFDAFGHYSEKQDPPFKFPTKFEKKKAFQIRDV